jgi:hypothetical protein
MKIQISISMMERIIENAKQAIKNNSSLSSTIELEQVSESDGHITPDHVAARVKVNYSECDGELIFNHWQ